MRMRYIAVNLLNFFFAAVESFLGLRFLLKLFGANANNGFVNWLYEMTGGLLDPFRGIFPTKVFENRYVLEFTTLFAMVMYAIIGLLLVALINAITAPAVAEEADEPAGTVVTRKRRVTRS